MKILSAFLFLSLAASLVSCGKKESSSSTSTAGSSGSSCLAKYDKNLADMLTKERLVALIDLTGVDPNQEVSDGSLVRYNQWTWPSERTRKMTILGNEQILPVDNTVKVSALKLLDKAEFGPKDGKTYVEQNFRSISAEEMKQIEANMEKGMKEAMAEKVKKGELTADQAKIGEGLGGSLMSKDRMVESIENVGDACRWIASDNELAVGHGNVFFSVVVDISADVSVNRGKAIELAKTILAECN